MDRTQALDYLGLERDASPEEIRERFRELARAHHPDAGGDPDRMIRLLEARDVALGATAMVPIDSIAEIVKATTSAVLQRARTRELTRETAEQIVRHRTSRLKRLKRMAAGIGAISGALAIISTQILPALDSVLQSGTGVTLGLTMAAGAMGLLFLMVSMQVDSIEHAVAELRDLLDDRESYADLLMAIVPEPHRADEWSRSAFEDFTRDWLSRRSPQESGGGLLERLERLEEDPLQRRVRRIGVTDFVRLCLATGLEHGLVRTHETVVDGKLATRHKLSFAGGLDPSAA